MILTQIDPASELIKAGNTVTATSGGYEFAFMLLIIVVIVLCLVISAGVILAHKAWIKYGNEKEATREQQATAEAARIKKYETELKEKREFSTTLGGYVESIDRRMGEVVSGLAGLQKDVKFIFAEIATIKEKQLRHDFEIDALKDKDK